MYLLSGKESACDAGDPGSVPVLGRSPGAGNGNPLQYSCLENPMDKRSLAGYSPWSSRRVRHDWSDYAAAAAYICETIITNKVLIIKLLTTKFLLPLGNLCLSTILFLYHLVQATNDLLSVSIEQFAFSRTLYKWNHTADIVLLPAFFHSEVIMDSSLVHWHIHSFKNSFTVMLFTCHKIHLIYYRIQWF